MRTDSNNPLWLLGDHLGSTSKVANFDGLTVHSQQLYKPWGSDRYSYGTTPTTGQLRRSIQLTAYDQGGVMSIRS